MKFIIGLIFFLATSLAAVSQPGSGPGDPGGGGDPDDGVPITGIEILLAAGGLLGAKKIHDNRKRKSK